MSRAKLSAKAIADRIARDALTPNLYLISATPLSDPKLRATLRKEILSETCDLFVDMIPSTVAGITDRFFSALQDAYGDRFDPEDYDDHLIANQETLSTLIQEIIVGSEVV